MEEPRYQPPDDAKLRAILKRAHCIAIVGVSPDPIRPSHYVARYLRLRGYRVIPVNPGHAGTTLFGETVRARLADCPPETDMLDVFRRSEQVPPVVEEALEALPNLRTIWLQIGIESDAAFRMSASRGIDFVQNRCPKIEYQRLFGELRMGGFNTGIISSKL
ncbi:CoA-binding protein [Pararhodobacter sp. SW119]|uniref:CoA-binding protein n=1 Tax=Pararhodobacter sp. SW119 TaxID=2780075 RepID=UPI001AE05F4F|nr:CoA-binding protein [Pararhodobacter sp. SW119]